MNNPLSGLIFKIIEQALEQDAVRRTEGVGSQAPPQLPQGELKHQVLSRVEAKLMMARARQGLFKSPQEVPKPAPPSAVKSVPQPEVEALKPNRASLPSSSSVMRPQERQGLKSLLLGQIILGPCKAMEVPQD